MHDPTRTDYGMAWHEAGHAVVRAVLGIPIDRVSLWSNHAGQWASTEPPLQTFVGRVPAQALASAALAGLASEESVLGRADDDYHPTGSDLSLARRLLEESASAEKLLADAKVEVAELLRKHEPAVEEIAELLLEHRTILGDRVHSAIASYGSGIISQ